jgi:hypothetical protein
MKFLLLTFPISFLCFTSVYAQTPIIVNDPTDTVFVQGSPVVQNKSLILNEEKTVRFYLNGYANVFSNSSYYEPCAECVEFLNAYKSALTPQASYGAGISLLYAPKNWVLETGLDYALIKEKFDFTNSLGIVYHSDNMTSYADIKLTGGYWFWRSKKTFSVVFQGGLVYNRLLGASGLVNDYYDTDNVLELSSSGKLRDNQLSGMVSGKFILLPQSRLKLTLEPYYMGSLANVTHHQYPYLELYNRLGLKAGVIFSL